MYDQCQPPSFFCWGLPIRPQEPQTDQWNPVDPSNTAQAAAPNFLRGRGCCPGRRPWDNYTGT